MSVWRRDSVDGYKDGPSPDKAVIGIGAADIRSYADSKAVSSVA